MTLRLFATPVGSLREKPAGSLLKWLDGSMQDGDFELQRKVPYDYDSEFQDMFMRIAAALYNGHMTVHEARSVDLRKKGAGSLAPCLVQEVVQSSSHIFVFAIWACLF